LVEVKPKFHSFFVFEEYAKMIPISYSIKGTADFAYSPKTPIAGFLHLKLKKKRLTYADINKTSLKTSLGLSFDNAA
jgi:hypothetical protein